MGVEEPTIFGKITQSFLLSLILLFFIQVYILEIINLYASKEDSISYNDCKKLKIIKYYLYILLSALSFIELVCIVWISYLINCWIIIVTLLAISFSFTVLFIHIFENNVIDYYDYYSALPDKTTIKIKDKKYTISLKMIKFIPKLIILFIFKITGSQEYILKKILLLEFNLNYFDNKLFGSEILSNYMLSKILDNWYVDY